VLNGKGAEVNQNQAQKKKKKNGGGKGKIFCGGPGRRGEEDKKKLGIDDELAGPRGLHEA